MASHVHWCLDTRAGAPREWMKPRLFLDPLPRYVLTYVRTLRIRIYVRTYVRMYVRTYVRTCIYTCTCTYTYVRTYVRIFIRACLYVRTYVRICILWSAFAPTYRSHGAQATRGPRPSPHHPQARPPCNGRTAMAVYTGRGRQLRSAGSGRRAVVRHCRELETT